MHVWRSRRPPVLRLVLGRCEHGDVRRAEPEPLGDLRITQPRGATKQGTTAFVGELRDLKSAADDACHDLSGRRGTAEARTAVRRAGPAGCVLRGSRDPTSPWRAGRRLCASRRRHTHPGRGARRGPPPRAPRRRYGGLDRNVHRAVARRNRACREVEHRRERDRVGRACVDIRPSLCGSRCHGAVSSGRRHQRSRRDGCPPDDASGSAGSGDAGPAQKAGQAPRTPPPVIAEGRATQGPGRPVSAGIGVTSRARGCVAAVAAPGADVLLVELRRNGACIPWLRHETQVPATT